MKRLRDRLICSTEPITPEQVAEANATETRVATVLKAIDSSYWDVTNAADLVRKLIYAGLIKDVDR